MADGNCILILRYVIVPTLIKMCTQVALSSKSKNDAFFQTLCLFSQY